MEHSQARWEGCHCICAGCVRRLLLSIVKLSFQSLILPQSVTYSKTSSPRSPVSSPQVCVPSDQPLSQDLTPASLSSAAVAALMAYPQSVANANANANASAIHLGSLPLSELSRPDVLSAVSHCADSNDKTGGGGGGGSGGGSGVGSGGGGSTSDRGRAASFTARVGLLSAALGASGREASAAVTRAARQSALSRFERAMWGLHGVWSELQEREARMREEAAEYDLGIRKRVTKASVGVGGWGCARERETDDTNMGVGLGVGDGGGGRWFGGGTVACYMLRLTHAMSCNACLSQPPSMSTPCDDLTHACHSLLIHQ